MARAGARVCYVSQEPKLNADATVFDEVARASEICTRSSATTSSVTPAGEPDADYDALLAAMEPLQTKLEAQNGWAMQHA